LSSLPQGSPQLTYILVTDTYATLRPVVARLLAQAAPDRIELVVIANRGGLDGIHGAELKALGRVQGIECDSVVNMDAARATGVRAATAPLVFIGETHSFPCAGWLDATLKAFDGPYSVVVPSVTNRCDRGLIQWAGYTLDYSRWHPAHPSGEVQSNLAHNISYRSDLLFALGDQLDQALDLYQERLLDDLRPQHPRIWFEPSARIEHVSIGFLWPALEDRLILGLLTGGTRARRWPVSRRLLYFLASPLIAAVLFVRDCEPLTGDALPPWKRRRASGGGVLLDLGSHHFDLLRWLLDARIGSALADTRSTHSEQDSADVHLRLGGGITVQCHFSFLTGPADHLEFQGDLGSLLVDRHRPTSLVRLRRRSGYGLVEGSPGRSAAQLRHAFHHWLRPGHDPSYRSALAGFADAVRGLPDPGADATDGWESLAAVLAAEGSIPPGPHVDLSRT